MATIAEMKKQEKEKKKKNKDKQKKVKLLLSKNNEDSRQIVSSENFSELEVLLERVLKPARLEKFKYSWSELKEIPKKKRRQCRSALMVGLDKEKYEKSKEIRDNFIFGTNSVIRSLERETALCCLISSDFEPVMIVDHIVSLSRQKRIPLILLPQLKSVCERCLGFSVKALAIKKRESLLEDDVYKSLYDKIFNLSGLANLPVESVKPEISTLSVPKSSHVKRVSPTVKNFILKRSNENSRCFVPGGTSSTESSNNVDFISFGSSVEDNIRHMDDRNKAEKDEDDNDSDLEVARPAPKLKRYVPMFQTLKLKKIKSKT